EDGDPPAVPLERERDLLGGEHATARSVEHDVDGHGRLGEVDRAQHLLGVLDVDVSSDRYAEEAHRLLAMDQRDHTGAAGPLERTDLIHALETKQVGLQEGDVSL